MQRVNCLRGWANVAAGHGIIIIIMKFINSAALSKIRLAASKCYSVLTKRCPYTHRAKVAVDCGWSMCAMSIALM